MAENLIARHGPEQAEKVAIANSAWYERGTPTHTYWLNVAEAIRKTAAR